MRFWAPKWSENGAQNDPETNLETGPKPEWLSTSRRRSAEVRESEVGGSGGAGHSEAEERSLRREFRLPGFIHHVPRGYGGLKRLRLIHRPLKIIDFH